MPSSYCHAALTLSNCCFTRYFDVSAKCDGCDVQYIVDACSPQITSADGSSGESWYFDMLYEDTGQPVSQLHTIHAGNRTEQSRAYRTAPRVLPTAHCTIELFLRLWRLSHCVCAAGCVYSASDPGSYECTQACSEAIVTFMAHVDNTPACDIYWGSSGGNGHSRLARLTQLHGLCTAPCDVGWLQAPNAGSLGSCGAYPGNSMPHLATCELQCADDSFEVVGHQPICIAGHLYEQETMADMVPTSIICRCGDNMWSRLDIGTESYSCTECSPKPLGYGLSVPCGGNADSEFVACPVRDLTQPVAECPAGLLTLLSGLSRANLMYTPDRDAEMPI